MRNEKLQIKIFCMLILKNEFKRDSHFQDILKPECTLLRRRDHPDELNGRIIGNSLKDSSTSTYTHYRSPFSRTLVNITDLNSSTENISGNLEKELRKKLQKRNDNRLHE